MKNGIKAAAAVALAAGTLQAQSTPAAKPHKRATHKPTQQETMREMLQELHEMRAKQAEQQAQIDQLLQQNAAKDAALAQAQQSVQTAQTQAAAATAQSEATAASVQSTADTLAAIKANVADIQTTNVGLAQTISANKVELNEKIESPTVIHYKGVTITPVAFFALEGVYRTRAINSDINTPFNTTPFPGSNEGHISEFNFSGRQSRLGGLFEGNAGNFKLSGYFEADFLSAGVTSNDNQSNSYTLRQRQIWGKAETKSGFAVTGGQMWSLVTEDGKSTDVRTEKLPNTVDPQYMVGYSWARQPAIRVQQRFGTPAASTTVAIALENAQTQLATSANAPTNYIFGGTGQGGGLFNAFNGTYANNVAPDVIAKVAFDAPHGHFELGGLARFFRDEYSPLVAGTANTIANTSVIVKNTKAAGGVFGSARVTSHYVDAAVQMMAGDGTARYGSAQLGDVTVHPDGTFEPLHNYHGLFSLETHPTKKLDLYAYYGGEYNQRTVYTGPTGLLVGYGVPNANDSGCYALTIGTPAAGGASGAPGAVANCASPTRYIQEGTIGYTYRLVQSPRYGRLQYQMTYSYLTKQTWSGLLNTTTGLTGSGRATNNLIYAGMRYYIP